MKKIFILSVGFPYGKHEPFLLNELPYHKNAVLVSSFIGSPKAAEYNLPEDLDLEVWHPESMFFSGNKIVMGISAVLCVVSPYFWQELFSKDIEPINIQKIVQLLSCISKAKQIEKYVSKKIKTCSCQGEYVFYAYWMNQLALAAVMLAKKHQGIAVARCHGYDLYKRKENNYYVTFQRYLTTRLEKIFPISEDGKHTLLSLFNRSEAIKNKIVVSRLGTLDYGLSPEPESDSEFTIVSCSNVTGLKRIDMIFDAIESISDFKIRWIHFGTGELFRDLLDRVQLETCGHLLTLAGYVQNNNIMKFYHENSINMFLNVSESEGIPVSIMEALSFGIPCVATDVGGVHEIIEDKKNGFLLKESCGYQDVADRIKYIRSMKRGEYNKLRSSARKSWETLYSAEGNYRCFLNGIGGSSDEH